ncbi:CRISPR-associated helicase Cas3' [Solwaraspora sp. WMMD1047]|uniref:CRISPR-associated helicase Cas3' n=1 Tax=Solwaraspora sp. WMMD1047 TaxID=3016102 RepID=UPI002415B829|nr:CRISPR-associated helicase Cas3' [Solwaraspora sp. WMMD1047]MDG4827686.1 CRISPR-associated helicase Cas3' [Solwaraspora sp. WMMD1047]MDG4834877.1 CRISPR-associated helicase Cas3' [Solwaraspora sp. WMMD1047]MDG4834892.1 CRISPR-associated helicase Cas3' [Solwaraspora sp. WMMD1047]
MDLRIWGKERGLASPYPLLWHLVDTAAVAGALWDGHLTAGQRRFVASGMDVDEGHARLLVMLWAGLHDLGKASPGFQVQCQRAYEPLRADPAYGLVAGGRDLGHDMASQLALVKLLGQDRPQVGPRSGQPAYRVAQMLGGHHGRFRSAQHRDLIAGRLGGGSWASQRSALFRTITKAVGSPASPERVDPRVAVLVTGLIILADWLASQEHYLRGQLLSVPADSSVEVVAAHLAGLCGRATRLLDGAGLGVPILRQLTFEEVFPFRPNALQRSIRDELLPRVDGPGLLIVTAATGDGKTEVALIAARELAEVSDASGFYFALPTMATADQMYKRVREFTNRVADGPAAVTLLHSLSWLNAAYEGSPKDEPQGDSDVASSDKYTLTAAPDWLKGRKRGLLAGFSVGTIDQALMAALATRHNALRLLGLSGKVFIVDEAHSYDDYMRAVLCKLLTWLGSMRCSVILLSATLPASHVHSLAAAYRRGAGLPPVRLGPVPYPGWVFVPARSGGSSITISTEAQAAVATGRRIPLRLDIRPVRHSSGSETSDPSDRRAVLEAVLTPLVRDRGYAAVVCNTVDDAQQTYEMTREWTRDRAEVYLLHSRFPSGQREEITQRIVALLGKDSIERHKRVIVVATQVIEQSLDLDFDLVVSDLAPLAQVLQRAGRCHRHARARPAWARTPRLVILDPHHDGRYAKPRRWGDVYHDYLLRATHLRLSGVETIRIPEDVQEHMEAVYSPTGIVDPQLRDEHTDYQVDEMVGRQAAELWTIPDPSSLGDLSLLSECEVADGQAATRLGADSVRVLCCYLDSDGRQWLDPHRRHPLPHHGSGLDGRYQPDDIRSLLKLSIPVRESLISGYKPDAERPARWDKTPWLSELHPLWFPIGPAGTHPIEIGGRLVHLDRDLGLIIRRTTGHR